MNTRRSDFCRVLSVPPVLKRRASRSKIDIASPVNLLFGKNLIDSFASAHGITLGRLRRASARTMSKNSLGGQYGGRSGLRI
jgi:hypothetical protein